jgi:hypothetical protein
MTAYRLLFALLVIGVCGCTTLGPMPVVTGQNPLPAGRPDLEVQAGAVPGYYLSSSVQERPEGTTLGQGAAMFEPGELVGLPGLAVGGRYVSGQGGDDFVEPMLRYRGFLDGEERFAASVVAHAAYASGQERSASYEATRAGLELTADARLTPKNKWFELHVLASIALLGLDASGRYCLDAQGKYGVDCPEPPDPIDNITDATVEGIFPAAVGGVAIDLGRHLDSIFHGGRITLMGGGGSMPRIVGGQQQGTQLFTAAGLTATLSVGAL